MADETYSGVRPTAVSAEGIRFVKNIMAPTRDGTKLALDIHVPAGGRPVARDPHLHPVPQGRPGAPSWDATPLGAARLRRRPRRLPGHRLQRRRERRRVPPRGNPRRLRRGRVDRRAGLVRRQSGNDRRLVRRIHQRAGRCLGAAASGNDHPLEFHRRQVHRRLSLPWRGPTLLLRHRRIRQLHGRHERNAALSRIQRRPLGRALGAAPGAKQPVPAHLAGQSKGR